MASPIAAAPNAFPMPLLYLLPLLPPLFAAMEVFNVPLYFITL